MNDPGLDKPIQEDAEEVKQQTKEQVKGEDPDGADNDESFLQPSRWWFASTAIPLVAGTFGPMASAFNICALAGKWRILVGPGQSEDNGEAVDDPGWLIGVNALSLVLALVANMALLLNMARRVSFTIAQPITIIGWLISSFLLIALLAAAHLAPSFQLPVEQNPALGQGFYYAIMAAALYFILSCLLCITVYGAHRGHYPKAFKLTNSQRTLMIQTISYLIYLVAGGAIFSHIEDWLFLNGVYWANTTLLTVGTGDFSPLTHTGQSLLFPYAIGGIVHLGLVIGSIRSLILERGKKKLGVRMVEKKREKITKQIEKNNGVVRVDIFTRKRNLATGDDPEFERRKQEFEVMRMIQGHAETKRKWYALCISITAWFTLWFIGAVVFWEAESFHQDWTFFEALYFCYVSLLTIGYGDYKPVANSSKAFFVFWSLLAIPTLTILISNMGDTVIKMVKDVTMYVSELTVLPGDRSTRGEFRRIIRGKRPLNIFGEGESPVEEPTGGVKMPHSEQDPEASAEQKPNHPALDKAIDRIGRDWEEEELEEVEEAHRTGDKIKEDRHLHHYLLVKEIRTFMKHTHDKPPKKYSYREWSYYLRLLGEDESKTKYHRQPPMDADADRVDGQPVFGHADEDPQTGRNDLGWSWVGTRSPLMSDEDESTWLLERFTEKLQQLLQEERRRNKREEKPGDLRFAHEAAEKAEESRDPAVASGSDSGRTLEHNGS